MKKSFIVLFVLILIFSFIGFDLYDFILFPKGDIIHKLQGDTNNYVVFSYDGQALVYSPQGLNSLIIDKTIRFYNVKENKDDYLFDLPASSDNFGMFAPHSTQYLYLGNPNLEAQRGLIYIYNYSTNTTRVVNGDTYKILAPYTINWVSDNEIIYSCGKNSSAWVDLTSTGRNPRGYPDFDVNSCKLNILSGQVAVSGYVRENYASHFKKLDNCTSDKAKCVDIFEKYCVGHSGDGFSAPKMCFIRGVVVRDRFGEQVLLRTANRREILGAKFSWFSDNTIYAIYNNSLVSLRPNSYNY